MGDAFPKRVGDHVQLDLFAPAPSLHQAARTPDAPHRAAAPTVRPLTPADTLPPARPRAATNPPAATLETNAPRAAFASVAETIQRALHHRLELPIEVTITDNVSTLMSFKPGSSRQPARLRIHHMFAAAENHVLDALARWLSKRQDKRAAAVLDGYIKRHAHLIDRRPRQQTRTRTQGRFVDLQELYDEVNAAEFEGRINVPITWGRMPTRRRRRSIRLGSYSPDDNLIRLHPLLDQPGIPRFFVRYIVFHEMLHADLGIETDAAGRRRAHTPEFRRREKRYCDYDRAVAWHDDPKNLAKLLRYKPQDVRIAALTATTKCG